MDTKNSYKSYLTNHIGKYKMLAYSLNIFYIIMRQNNPIDPMAMKHLFVHERTQIHYFIENVLSTFDELFDFVMH